MQPLGNKILVRVINEEEKRSAGGIILTDKDPLRRVQVKSVSPDTATDLKEGDICLSEYGGVEISKNLFLCNESLIWAKE